LIEINDGGAAQGRLRQLRNIRRDPPRVIAHWRFTPTR
jgi:hypothetical protein